MIYTKGKTPDVWRPFRATGGAFSHAGHARRFVPFSTGFCFVALTPISIWTRAFSGHLFFKKAFFLAMYAPPHVYTPRLHAHIHTTKEMP